MFRGKGGVGRGLKLGGGDTRWAVGAGVSGCSTHPRSCRCSVAWGVVRPSNPEQLQRWARTEIFGVTAATETSLSMTDRALMLGSIDESTTSALGLGSMAGRSERRVDWLGMSDLREGGVVEVLWCCV